MKIKRVNACEAVRSVVAVLVVIVAVRAQNYNHCFIIAINFKIKKNPDI